MGDLVVCRHCGWEGSSDDVSDSGLDEIQPDADVGHYVECPECDSLILI